MKRPLYLWLVPCLASALAGWGLAWKQAANQRRDAGAAISPGERPKAGRIAAHLAALIRSADEVTFVTSFRDAGDPRKVRCRDPIWISRLADAIAQSTCQPAPHGMWISSPEVKLYRKGQLEVGLMTLGHVLRVLGPEDSGDFIIGPETTTVISNLIHEKQSGSSP